MPCACLRFMMGVGLDADVLIAYDYITDCVCNGFFYIRALPETHQWLFEIVRWLYNNPYEHDQRAISAFLNYTERIAILPEDSRRCIMENHMGLKEHFVDVTV
eukprot:1975522-Amphidinium_carterae.1